MVYVVFDLYIGECCIVFVFYYFFVYVCIGWNIDIFIG